MRRGVHNFAEMDGRVDFTSKMHIDYVANGMGAQSMYLLYLASQKRIPATVSLTADTGWENDCDLNDGTKTTAREFFDNHIKPFADKWGVDAYFVRAVNGKGEPRPSIYDYLVDRDTPASIPLYGSNKGQMMQSCTDRWKIQAMKQQCRRMGAITARSAQGIHWGERARRVKGQFIESVDGFDIYRHEGVRWHTHYYPLVDLQLDRAAVKREMDGLGLPYLISSECAGCPHADAWRWLRRTPETIEMVAQIEDKFDGFYFTDQRRPLRDVIADWREMERSQGNLFDQADFGCKSEGVCGI